MPAARARAARGVGLPGDRHAEERARARAPPRAPAGSASRPRPRARPAPPTTTATPGSWASRPTCCASSGWASTTTRRWACSGTRAALPIWVDFMKTALDGQTAGRVPARARGHRVVEIDSDTGLAGASQLPQDAHGGCSWPAPSRASPAAPTDRSPLSEVGPADLTLGGARRYPFRCPRGRLTQR